MKKWIKEKIKEFIGWYILCHEHGCFDVRRKGGAEQTCRIFSTQAHENIVKPAFECGGVFYTQEQVNRAVKETVKAVIKCDKNEVGKCEECYLRLEDDTCIKNIM